MKTILTLYVAQAKQFFREGMAVLFVLLLPVVFGVFFGLLFSGGSPKPLQVGLVNEDQAAGSFALQETLAAMEVDGSIVLRTGSDGELRPALDDGELAVIIILPPGLTAALEEAVSAPVEVWYDPTSAASGAGLELVQGVLTNSNMAMSQTPQLLQMVPQAIPSQPVRPIDFYMSGMLGIALLWLGIFGVAQPLVAQREAQILRRFSLTPITSRTMLAAEVSWRVSIGLIQVAIFLTVGSLGFDLTVQDWALFAAAAISGTMVFVTMGYVLAGIARSAESAMGIAQVFNFPMMMLSGSFIDIEMLPAVFQPVAKAMPLTYLEDLLRQSMAGAPAQHSLALNFGVLGGSFLVMLLLAIKLWKWE